MVSLQSTILSYEELSFTPNVQEPACYSKGSIMEFLSKQKNYSHFMYLIKLSGLEMKLKGNTLLLPNNQSIKKKLSLSEIDKNLAQKIVLYHTLSGRYTDYLLKQNSMLQLNTLYNKGELILYQNTGKMGLLNNSIRIIGFNHLLHSNIFLIDQML